MLEKGLAWGITQEEIDALMALLVIYDEKYRATSNPSLQNPSTTAARDAAWDNLWPKALVFYTRFLQYNDLISAEDQEALGISERAIPVKRSIPAPTTLPDVKIEIESPASIILRHRQEEAPFRAKPYGVAFCDVRMKIGGEAPVSVSECTEEYNLLEQREQVSFDYSQRGQTIYCFARWVNHNGKKGPWTGLFTAIIP